MGISQQIGASSLSKPGVCTSSTRPATPYEGQQIYETDTDKVLVWNGSAWYANWNLPFGIVALTSSTSSDSTITAEEVQITGSSFTAVANRYYKITYFEPELYGSLGYMTATIRLTNISGAVKQLGYVDIYSSNREAICNLQWVGTLSAGSTNFVATLTSNSGTGQAYRSATMLAFLLVEDIGPV